MTPDLLWPGLHRVSSGADAATSDDEAFLTAMGRVESCWAQAGEAAGLVTPGTASALDAAWRRAVTAGVLDPRKLAVAAEGGGNPVIPMLSAVRRELDQAAGAAVHRGLTSQDVVDTAMMLCLRTAFDELRAVLRDHVLALAAFARRYRDVPALAHTLGQAALPTTLGRRAAGWLDGATAALEQVRGVTFPVQAGDAVGTLADTFERFGAQGETDPAGAVDALVRDFAARLGLSWSDPWHTTRTPVTRIGDALVTTSDALGHFANDVLLGSRTEVGELAEPTGPGRGGSSAMPQKRNPVLSVLVRRHALSAPLTAAQLHLASADSGEERPCGAWHTEWAVLRDLTRRTVAAASQAAEVSRGLVVDRDAVRRNLAAALPGALAQRLQPALARALPGGADEARRVLAGSSTPAELRSAVAPHLDAGHLDDLLDPARYLGVSGALVDRAVARAQAVAGQEAPETAPDTDQEGRTG